MRPKTTMRSMSKWLCAVGMVVGGALIQAAPASPIHGIQEIERIILSRSLTNQVVMFGGQHEAIRSDDDFVANLLPSLKRQGFKYLAVEFEKNPRKESFHRIVQDYASGKITIEEMRETWIRKEKLYCPGTFDLINTARKAGMKVVFYDADEDAYICWHEREKISFDNLKELIFEKDPNAKVVIFCGALHINKKPHRNVSAGWWGCSEEKIQYLASYIEDGSGHRNFTVSLLGGADSKAVAPFCDFVVDLDTNQCYFNSESK